MGLGLVHWIGALWRHVPTRHQPIIVHWQAYLNFPLRPSRCQRCTWRRGLGAGGGAVGRSPQAMAGGRLASRYPNASVRSHVREITRGTPWDRKHGTSKR